MNPNILWFLAIVAMAGVGALGDYFLKLAGNGKSFIDWKLFALGAIIYGSTALGWFFILKHTKLATLGAVYAVAITILLALIGFFFFKETLSYTEITGITLGIISLLLLVRFV